MSNVWSANWIWVNENKIGAMAGTDSIIPEEASQYPPEELKMGFLRPSVPLGLNVQSEAVLTWVSKATWPIKFLGTAAGAERREMFVLTNTIHIKIVIVSLGEVSIPNRPLNQYQLMQPDVLTFFHVPLYCNCWNYLRISLDIHYIQQQKSAFYSDLSLLLSLIQCHRALHKSW